MNKKKIGVIILILGLLLIVTGIIFFKTNTNNKQDGPKKEEKENNNNIPKYIELSDLSNDILERYAILFQNGRNTAKYINNDTGLSDQIYFLENFNNINGTPDKQAKFIAFYMFYNGINAITYGGEVNYTDPQVSKCVGGTVCRRIDLRKLQNFLDNSFGIQDFDINTIVSDDPYYGIIMENGEYLMQVYRQGTMAPLTNYYLSEKKIDNRIEIICQVGEGEEYKATFNKYKIIIQDYRIIAIDKISNITTNDKTDNTPADLKLPESIGGITKEEAFDLYNLFLPKYNEDGTGRGSSINPMKLEKKLIHFSDLNNTSVWSLLIAKLVDNDKIVIDDNTFKIMVSTFDNYSSKYFGTKMVYPQTLWVFPANCNLEDDRYVCTKTNTGGEALSSWIYLPYAYNVENNELSITGLALYSNMDGFLTKKDGIKYCDGFDIHSITKCLYDNKNNYTKIILKLDIENGNRVFKSIEKVEGK